MLVLRIRSLLQQPPKNMWLWNTEEKTVQIQREKKPQIQAMTDRDCVSLHESHLEDLPVRVSKEVKAGYGTFP